MDPINILLGIGLFVSLTANYSGSKKGIKSKVTKVVERPSTFLQKTPLNIAALTVLLEILGVFSLGTFSNEYGDEYQWLRIAGLAVFIVFAWLQVKSYKALGNSYTPDIAILKDHKLIKNGIYKYVRHPQYFGQILGDLGAGIALMSYLVIPLVILVQIPLFVMRANYEEKLLEDEFEEDFKKYKKGSGFFFPFIG